MNRKDTANMRMPGRGPGGPGPRGGGEKANDLVGTWKKLLGYCKKYIVVIVIALICAAVGTVLTLIGPDKLSDMTDSISAGIQPNTEKLEEISQSISSSLSDNMEVVMSGILAPIRDGAQMEQKAAQIMASSAISNEDKLVFQQVMAGMGAPGSEGDTVSKLLSLPDSVLQVLFADTRIGGVTIPWADQVQALALLGNLDENDGGAAQSAISALPETVQNALYTDIVVDGVTISAADQKAFLSAFAGIDPEDEEAALHAMDSLPGSVSSLMESSIDMDKIFTIAFTLVAMYAASYILSAIQGWSMATVTQRVSKQMRKDISRKINRLPMWFYNRTSTGDVLSRVTNDVDTISQSLNQSISSLVSAGILFVGSLFMMLKTNLLMTVTAVLASLLGFVFMFAIMGRSQKYFFLQQKNLGKLNGHIEEMFTGHTVVKAYNGEEASGKTFDTLNKNLQESGFKAQCLAGLMQPIMAFIGNLGYVAVCMVGGAMALNGKISFGVIVAFIMYVRYFTQPLSQIAQAMQSLQSAAAAGERIFEFLEAEEMEDESHKTAKLENTKGFVEFDHVRFGYEDSDSIVINDFCAVAKPGQKIAIVGPTGAGKTTLVNLLMRFHEIQGGEIRIDGTPTRKLTREEVHSQFCMVLQDTWLFEGTVRENLVYCTEGVSDEKITGACKAVGLDHYIRTLPKGYDTVLNDQVNLSQGQKQQLTIARAMIADKPMLILDEATSSVDTRTELQIQNAMDKLMENRTSFVIAHRLSTIKNADLILVMKNGDIIESGVHEELLAKGGFYAGLYNSQFDQAS
ncbi:MAG: ABC transporter ATP-binding protein [Faecousia sp.]